MNNLSLFFRDSKPISQLLGLFFLLLLGFILSMGLQLLSPADFDSPAGIRMSLLLQCLSQLLVFFTPAVLFVILFKGDTCQYLQLDFHGSKWGLALVAMVIFFLLTPVNDWLTWWNEQWDFGSMEETLRRLSDTSKEAVVKMLSLTSVGDLLLQLFVVALIPAVCEELFFRGALQQIFHQCFGNKHVAIFVTALVFTLAHGDMYGLVPRFVLGLLLGYLFVLSGSIIVNICAHFFNNAIVVVLFFLYHKGVIAFDPSMPLGATWLTTLLCTLAAAALFGLYFIGKGPKRLSKNSI